MTDSNVRVPAGWYPDPLGLPQLRWWDNHSWTEHTSDARQPMVATETVTPRLAFADDEEFNDDRLYVIDDDSLTDDLTRRGRRERERLETETVLQQADSGATRVNDHLGFGDPLLSLEAPVRDEISVDEPSPAVRFAEVHEVEDAPMSTPFLLDTRFDDLLGETIDETSVPRPAFEHVSESTTTFVPEARPEAQYTGEYDPRYTSRTSVSDNLPRASTGPVWVIALMPLLVLVLALLFLLSNMAGSASSVFIAVIAIVPYVATVGLAVVDRRILKSHGFQHTAHWAWAFLTAPVYLTTRLAAAVRETGRGFGPLLTWGAFALLSVGSLVAVPGLVIAMAPGTFSSAVQQSVEQDAISLGANLKVECPAIPPQLIGSSFQCRAIDSHGTFFDVTVSLQRANGWIEWRVDDWGIYSMTS